MAVIAGRRLPCLICAVGLLFIGEAIEIFAGDYGAIVQVALVFLMSVGAIVLLPSKRVRSWLKVKIGDRIDGGTIAAISEDALVYRKGGRNFELNMPQG